MLEKIHLKYCVPFQLTCSVSENEYLGEMSVLAITYQMLCFLIYQVLWNRIVFVCLYFQLEKLIEKNYFLHKSAQEAYKAYIRAYDSHSLKQIYSVNHLDLLKVALSFGFKVPPFVDLSILLLQGIVSILKHVLSNT